MLRKLNQADRRKRRVRADLKHNAVGKPRLSVHRSSKHIYAQLIDDVQGRTVAAASSLEKEMKGKLKTGADKAAAAGWASCWRSGRPEPASATSFSTGEPTSITAASRRWPTVRAKAD
jgi:ribosomal protein L18